MGGDEEADAACQGDRRRSDVESVARSSTEEHVGEGGEVATWAAARAQDGKRAPSGRKMLEPSTSVVGTQHTMTSKEGLW